MNDKKDFESYFDEYKKISEDLSKNDISLETAISKYNKSKEIYNNLKEIIDKAKLELDVVKDE